MTYLIQIDGETREATSDEATAIANRENEFQSISETFLNKQTLKSVAIAKLGLTDDEVAALFG